MRAVSDSTKYDNSPLQVVWRVSPVRCTANFTTIDYNRHNGKIYFGVQTHFEGEGTRELTESERARRGRCGWKYRIGNGAVIDPGQQGAGSVRTEAMAPGNYTITLFVTNRAGTNFTKSATVVVPAPTVTMLAKPPAVSSNEYYFFEFGASPPRCSTSCTMTRNQAATWSSSATTRMWGSRRR